MMTLAPGSTVGPYRIVSQLDRNRSTILQDWMRS